MNINYKNNDYQFNLRSAALIFNKDMTKILLFNVEGRTINFLPGGRVEELEESSNAISREIKEEIGWDDLDFSLVAISEEFVNDKGYNNQQITFIYKAIYNEEISNNKFKGLEGEWINFLWVDVEDLDNYEIFPSFVKRIIKDPFKIYHIVDNLISNNQIIES